MSTNKYQFHFHSRFLNRKEGRVLTVLFFVSLIFRLAVAADSDTAAQPIATSFHYTLVGVAKIGGVSYASLIDRETGYHYLLSTATKSQLDVELSSVGTDDDASGPSAIIQKDGESFLLKIGFGDASVTHAKPAGISRFASANPSSATESALSLARKLKPPAGATLPLVFQEVDPKKMTLFDEQKAQLAQLRQNFVDAITGTNSTDAVQSSASANSQSQVSAPTDQQLQNWLTAQEKSDEQFRMLFGNEAFNAYTESSFYPTAP